MPLNEEIAKKRTQMKKKRVFSPYHKSIATMAKIHKLHYELVLHLHYSPDLAPSDSWMFADLKGMVQGKRFGPNEEVMPKTVGYLEA